MSSTPVGRRPFSLPRLESTPSTERLQRPPPPARPETAASTDGFDAGEQRRPPFLDAAASALGLSADELDEKLRSGESLTDIAQAQGVSPEALQAALAADIKQHHPDTSDDIASKIASRIIEGPGQPPPSGPDAAQRGQHGPPPFITAAAEALGLSADELTQRLKAGESLSDVAESQGVSTDALKTALENDLQTQRPDVTEAQRTAMVDGLLEARAGERPDLAPFRARDLQRLELSDR